MSNEYNMAGRSLVVDSITELRHKGSTKSSVIRSNVQPFRIEPDVKEFGVRMETDDQPGVILTAYCTGGNQCNIQTPAGVIRIDCRETADNPARILIGKGTGYVVLKPNDDGSLYYPLFLRMAPQGANMRWERYTDIETGNFVDVTGAWVIGTFSYDVENTDRRVQIYSSAISFWDAQIDTFMKALASVENASDEDLNNLASAMGVDKVFNRIAVLEALVRNLKALNVRVGLGRGEINTGFRVRIAEYDDNGHRLENPWFDVYYDDVCLFKIDSETAKVYLANAEVHGVLKSDAFTTQLEVVEDMEPIAIDVANTAWSCDDLINPCRASLVNVGETVLQGPAWNGTTSTWKKAVGKIKGRNIKEAFFKLSAIDSTIMYWGYGKVDTTGTKSIEFMYAEVGIYKMTITYKLAHATDYGDVRFDEYSRYGFSSPRIYDRYGNMVTGQRVTKDANGTGFTVEITEPNCWFSVVFFDPEVSFNVLAGGGEVRLDYLTSEPGLHVFDSRGARTIYRIGGFSEDTVSFTDPLEINSDDFERTAQNGKNVAEVLKDLGAGNERYTTVDSYFTEDGDEYALVKVQCEDPSIPTGYLYEDDGKSIHLIEGVSGDRKGWTRISGQFRYVRDRQLVDSTTITPKENRSYDLGSYSKRFRSAYAGVLCQNVPIKDHDFDVASMEVGDMRTYYVAGNANGVRIYMPGDVGMRYAVHFQSGDVIGGTSSAGTLVAGGDYFEFRAYAIVTVVRVL